MAGTLFAGVNSLVLKLDTPYDTIRTTDVRDDLIKVKVWCSATPNFTPVDTYNALGVANTGANQVFDGLSLSITISGLPNGTATPTPLVAGTPYYVRYAFISDIQEDVYTVSNQLTKTPISASAQTIDISGYTSFVQNAALVFTPLNATLTAVLQNITGATSSWSIQGGSPSTATGDTVTITPSANAVNVTVTLTVSGGNLVSNLTKTVIMPILYNGAKGEAGIAGSMSAFPTIYKWTSSATPPARPTTASTYTWGNPTFAVTDGWETTIPSNTTPGDYLWSITIPLATSGETIQSSLDWTSTSYPIRAISYNGKVGDKGDTGNPGSASYVIERGASTNNAAPTNAEVFFVIGRNPIAGDMATVSYNNYNGALIYKYSDGWALMTTYIPGSLIVEGTITGNKMVAGTIDAQYLSIGNPNVTNYNRIRLYDNKIEVWDASNSGQPRVRIGNLA
jgi:hypothetical protein